MARYQTAARYYDTLSLERWLYRDGRREAIRSLALAPGARVLDLGAGTGLSLPGLAEAVGSDGFVHAIERSAAMIAQARQRVATIEVGTPIELTCADVAELPAEGTYDAALFAYSLSVVESWEQAWAWTLERVRPGGRIAVLDTDWPTGPARALSPGAAGIFALGAVRPGRKVWELPAHSLSGVASRSLRSGHVRLAVGTVPEVASRDCR